MQPPEAEPWCSTLMYPAGHWASPWSAQWTATSGQPRGLDREPQSPGTVIWRMQVG